MPVLKRPKSVHSQRGPVPTPSPLINRDASLDHLHRESINRKGRHLLVHYDYSEVMIERFEGSVRRSRADLLCHRPLRNRASASGRPRMCLGVQERGCSPLGSWGIRPSRAGGHALPAVAIHRGVVSLTGSLPPASDGIAAGRAPRRMKERATMSTARDTHDYGYLAVEPAQLDQIRDTGLSLSADGLHFSTAANDWRADLVILRFPAPDDAAECQDCGGDTRLHGDGCIVFSNWVSHTTLPPHLIEVCQDGAWAPLLEPLPRLLAYCATSGLDCEDLDELIHDLAERTDPATSDDEEEHYGLVGEAAAAVNNDGLESQLAFILELSGGDYHAAVDTIEAATRTAHPNAFVLGE